MKPIEVRIQNYDTQTGITDRFAVMWKYGAGRQKQRAYQIDVFLNEELVFSTGKIISDEQNNICLEHEFIEQTEYNFTVSVWDEKDQKEISERTFFLTGVKDWKGDWIGNDTKKPFLARKRFWVPKDEKAVLSVCVPGQFEVRINGHKISQYTYEGSQTDFDKHVHYSTYDVSESVIKGENEITIECANGWYLGDNDNGKRHFYTMDKGYRAFGDCLAVLAQLKAGAVYVVTDTSWEIAKSMVTLANIYGSEDIDHTIDYVWEQAKCVQGSKGEVIPGNYPPVIRKYEYLPVQVDHERMIFDFGQNMSSQFYLKVNGKKGQKIVGAFGAPMKE